MTDPVELKLRYLRIFKDLQSIFGPLFDDDDDPVKRGPGDYSPGGPPPMPWLKRLALVGPVAGGPPPQPLLQGLSLGRAVGEALVLAAQVKVAGEMAGNEALAGAAKGRIMALMDEDWCPTYPHVLKPPPPPPIGVEPPPRPEWQDFEALVSTVLGHHQALPDGAMKVELAGIMNELAGPG